MELFKEVTSGYTPEQMQSLFNQAKQMGVPEDIITKLQGNEGVSTIEK